MGLIKESEVIYLNWKKEAVEDLRALPARRCAIENIKNRIKMLEEQFTSLPTGGGSSPVMGGASRTEDALINNIAARQRLEMNLRNVQALVDLTEKGLAGVDEAGKKILDLFYINRIPGYVDKLCEELYLEKSQIYRDKDDALYRFTVNMYGIIDL